MNLNHKNCITVVLVLKCRLYDVKDFRAFEYAFQKSESFEKFWNLNW